MILVPRFIAKHMQLVYMRKNLHEIPPVSSSQEPIALQRDTSQQINRTTKKHIPPQNKLHFFDKQMKNSRCVLCSKAQSYVQIFNFVWLLLLLFSCRVSLQVFGCVCFEDVLLSIVFYFCSLFFRIVAFPYLFSHTVSFKPTFAT